MRAVVINEFGGPEVLTVQQVPLPVAASGEIRIKVAATGINPIDLMLRSGGLRGALPERDSYIPGMDVAGVVEQLGAGVEGFALGQAVVALVPYFTEPVGAYAEYVTVPTTAAAAAPRSTDLTAAATLPLNGITALAALDVVDPGPSTIILVTGAAGAVGSYAVQLAAQRGATVIAIADAADEQFLRDIGAQHVVPRGESAVLATQEIAPKGVDGVIDAALLGQSLLPAVRDGGSFAALFAYAAPPEERDITVKSVMQTPDGQRLAQLVALVDAGQLTLRVAQSYPLDQAAAAHARLASGGVRGRLVLLP